MFKILRAARRNSHTSDSAFPIPARSLACRLGRSVVWSLGQITETALLFFSLCLPNPAAHREHIAPSLYVEDLFYVETGRPFPNQLAKSRDGGSRSFCGNISHRNKPHRIRRPSAFRDQRKHPSLAGLRVDFQNHRDFNLRVFRHYPGGAG